MSHGTFTHRKSEDSDPRDDIKYNFYLMPNYGQLNLQQFSMNHLQNLDELSILELGLKVFDALRLVHKAGYVYNDLKYDNIMLQNVKMNNPKSLFSAEITLIDMGYATKFYTSVLTAEGIRHGHIPQKEVETFQGNMMNASINQLLFKNTSRRDDLMSLCYMLCQMFRKGELPYAEKLLGQLEASEMTDLAKGYRVILRTKLKMDDNDVAFIDCEPYKEFVKKIFLLQFDEEP